MSYVTNTLSNLIHQTAFFNLTWGNYLMIAVACVFLYLAIKHGFEPLLLVSIAFGMLLVNTKLCSCSHQETDRVCDQRTEVCHRTDTQEDQ